jgi:hypothetical protein
MGLIHHWQRTFVIGTNNFKKQGVYVRETVQGDHALQRKMCTEFKRLFSEACASPLIVQVEGTLSIYNYREGNLRTYLIVCTL